LRRIHPKPRRITLREVFQPYTSANISPKIYESGKRIVHASRVSPANWVIFVDAIFEMMRITQKSVTRVVNRNEFIGAILFCVLVKSKEIRIFKTETV
jgi:hypothetical protein